MSNNQPVFIINYDEKNKYYSIDQVKTLINNYLENINKAKIIVVCTQNSASGGVSTGKTFQEHLENILKIDYSFSRLLKSDATPYSKRKTMRMISSPNNVRTRVFYRQDIKINNIKNKEKFKNSYNKSVKNNSLTNIRHLKNGPDAVDTDNRPFFKKKNNNNYVIKIDNYGLYRQTNNGNTYTGKSGIIQVYLNMTFNDQKVNLLIINISKDYDINKSTFNNPYGNHNKLFWTYYRKIKCTTNGRRGSATELNNSTSSLINYKNRNIYKKVDIKENNRNRSNSYNSFTTETSPLIKGLEPPIEKYKSPDIQSIFKIPNQTFINLNNQIKNVTYGKNVKKTLGSGTKKVTVTENLKLRNIHKENAYPAIKKIIDNLKDILEKYTVSLRTQSENIRENDKSLIDNEIKKLVYIYVKYLMEIELNRSYKFITRTLHDTFVSHNNGNYASKLKNIIIHLKGNNTYTNSTNFKRIWKEPYFGAQCDLLYVKSRIIKNKSEQNEKNILINQILPGKKEQLISSRELNDIKIPNNNNLTNFTMKMTKRGNNYTKKVY